MDDGSSVADRLELLDRLADRVPGDRPKVGRACHCEPPTWWHDETGTRCAKCGRRPRARFDPSSFDLEDFRIIQL